MDLIASLICVIILTVTALFEKHALTNHHYMKLSLGRLFYMLLVTFILLLLITPNALNGKYLFESITDYSIISVGVLTAIGMILYYWLLSSKDLYLVSMLWPVTLILTTIAGIFLFNEKINKLQWLGIIIIFIGLSLVLLCK